MQGIFFDECKKSNSVQEQKFWTSFDSWADWFSNFAGNRYTFYGAALLVLFWGLAFPLFPDFETWEVVFSLSTNIITFLMVFLIQKAQNKDSKAIQIKLNELIAAHEKASNRIVDIEDLTEKELDKLHRYYQKLSEIAERDNDLHKSHSIDAAVDNDEHKQRNDQIHNEIEKDDRVV